MPYREQFVSRYLNPLEVEDEFRAIADSFPQLCSLEELPYLTHGYSGVHVPARGKHRMHVMRITSPVPAPSKAAVLLMRSPHAREWVNALAVVETARQLAENYRPHDTDPRVQAVVTTLDNAEVFIVPEGNPDGARYSFFDPGQRMWRKNLRPPPATAGCPGVDCNRNYPRYFGEAGSSDSLCSSVYRGPHSLSEPETANISHVINQYRNIIFAIDSHSYGQALFRPHPDGGTYISSLPVPPDDHATFLRLEELMNDEIATVAGVTYHTGTTSNHAGTSDEFLYFDHGVFGFDLECAQQFQPPIADAVSAALEVAAATRALAWCAAGQTDVDVSSLLERRRESIVDEIVTPDSVDESWEIVESVPETWRRFVVRIRAPRGDTPQSLLFALLQADFDVTDLSEETVDVMASAEELVKLLQSGWKIDVLADIYALQDDP